MTSRGMGVHSFEIASEREPQTESGSACSLEPPGRFSNGRRFEEAGRGMREAGRQLRQVRERATIKAVALRPAPARAGGVGAGPA